MERPFWAYGYPYCEMPRSYIRKLTLAPALEAFQKLERGESVSLVWEIKRTAARDFSQCVQRTWEYSFDTFRPQPVDTPYSTSYMKEVLSHFFEESYVATQPLHYYSGVELETATCVTTEWPKLLCGTHLLIFNALDMARPRKVRLWQMPQHLTVLADGFTETGFFQAKQEYGHPGKSRCIASAASQKVPMPYCTTWTTRSVTDASIRSGKSGSASWQSVSCNCNIQTAAFPASSGMTFRKWTRAEAAPRRPPCRWSGLQYFKEKVTGSSQAQHRLVRCANHCKGRLLLVARSHETAKTRRLPWLQPQPATIWHSSAKAKSAATMPH